MQTIQISSLVVSRFGLDGGAMFGVVPRPLWERKFPPDDCGRIELVSRCLLAVFDAPRRVVVVDAGMGAVWTDVERERFRLEPGVIDLGTQLAARGIRPTDVTDVIMTHLHFDHAGGWVEPGADGSSNQPVFSSARHHVQREHLEWAQSPSVRDRGSFLNENFEPLQRAGLLNPIEGETEMWPGLTVLLSDGHTPAMQMPLFEGAGGQKIFYPSDLMPTSAHVRAAWGMAFDLEPLKVIEEKRAILERATREDWIIAFEHDPNVSAARVQPDGDWYALAPCDLPEQL